MIRVYYFEADYLHRNVYKVQAVVLFGFITLYKAAV